MARPSAKKALLGDTDDNLTELLDQVVSEMGGQGELAKHLAKHLTNPDSNPYLQSRAFQTLVRIMDKVDARKPSGTGEAPLSDDDLEASILRDTVRFMVSMPNDLYESLSTRIKEQRELFAMREEKARLAREKIDRPIGNEIPGLTKSPLA